MTDPSVGIHVKENAVPKSVHTPAQIPLYWQHKVHDDLLCDEALDVIEKIPYGEPVSWCNWMAVTRKHDGTPRRTVDKFYERETFASASPFQSAHRMKSSQRCVERLPQCHLRESFNSLFCLDDGDT